MIHLLLGEGLSENLWYDHEVFNARKLLKGLSPDEWQTLVTGWSALSLELQDRLAYLLGEDASVREAELLLHICWEADREIELTARESLRNMPLDAVMVASRHVTQQGALPCNTSNHCATINQLLDFLRAERTLRDTHLP